MMMPERNQKLDERGDPLATEDDYQRSERTTAEQQRGTDDVRSDETRPDEMRPDEMRDDEMRDDEMRSGELPADEMRSGELPADEMRDDEMRTGELPADETRSGEQFSGGRLSEEQGGHSTDGHQERLVPEDHASSYASRWDAIKGTFVDEPREAVAQADALVGELLDELETLFREQRRDIEQGLDADETSTEDLRMALRRYRSFFDRLLAV